MKHYTQSVMTVWIVIFIVFFATLTTVALCVAGTKAGGEPCKSNSDCITSACSSGKCDPCPSRNNCPAPGLCSRSDLDSMQKEKDKLCSNTSCAWARENSDAVDCGKLEDNRDQAERCITIRDRIMDKCFRGGDDNHQRVLAEATKVRDYCKLVINYKKSKKACK